MEAGISKEAFVLIAIVAGVLQMSKRLPIYESIKGYLPVIGIAIGITLAYLQGIPSPILTGLIIGLSATGSYEAIKKHK